MTAPLAALGRTLAALALVALLGACERAPSAGAGPPGAPLLDGLGAATFEPATGVPQAKRYFQQGLQLAYGFDHAEARRSFAEAARLDPRCAMCEWGLAYVTGPNINRPERDRLEEARAHARRALKLVRDGDPRERALIEALALRFGLDEAAATPAFKSAPPLEACAVRMPRDADPHDVAYARAMAAVELQFPDDPDVLVLHAEALMMLASWDWWRDGQPTDGTLDAIARLERVLARTPGHAGANHYLIHAFEQSPTPERALSAAQRLPALAPNAAHMVHMPAHIYVRLGRYADASRANAAAVTADEALAAQIRAQGYATLSHPSHHHHFLWSSAALEGRGALALQAARDVAQRAAAYDEMYGGGNDYFLGLPLFAQVRFARWDEILAAPEPGGATVYPRAVWHWARGMAQARRGDATAAERELAALRELIADRSLDDRSFKGIDELRAILAVAESALEGEALLARKRAPEALAALRRAVEREDALESEEPPLWAASTRVELGSALLLAGRPADAERAFRDDLLRHPENGWALYGLAESLRRQQRTREARAVQQRFVAAWRAADLPRPDARY